MYFRTLKYGGTIDDDAAIARAAQLRDKNPLVDIWRHIRGDYISSPAFSHGLSILVHTLNCVLIYYAFGKSNMSFLAALLFAVNPVNNQVAIWMSGRTYGISTSLILMGFTFSLLFPLCYFFSFFWSINAIVAPLVFLAMPMPLYALTIVLAYPMRKHFWKTFADRKKTVPPRMNKVEWKKLILVPKTFAYYTLLCLFPMRVGMCHSYLHTFGLTEEETKPWFKLDAYFWLGVAELAGIVTLFAMGHSYKYIGLTWFTIFIIQWCNFIVINHPIAERYAYMANVGMMVFLAQMIHNTPLAYAVFAAYAVRMWLFVPAYKDDATFWEENIKNFPTVAMAYNQLGLALQKVGKFGTVFDVFVQGIQHRKNDFRLNYNTAGLLTSNKRFDIVKPFIKAAEENVDPMNNPQVWYDNLAKMKKFCADNGVVFDGNGTEVHSDAGKEGASNEIQPVTG
jgi:hypothetical protein